MKQQIGLTETRTALRSNTMDTSSKPIGSVPRRCWAAPAHRFSTTSCRAVAATPGDSELLFLRARATAGRGCRFLELGMDSLMAVELRNRLLGQLGSAFTITATAVVDYPTIGSLAEHLASQVPELVEVESVGTPEPTQ
jgi:hypothetical protein